MSNKISKEDLRLHETFNQPHILKTKYFNHTTFDVLRFLQISTNYVRYNTNQLFLACCQCVGPVCRKL